ncbi:MAG TPA: CHAD domain-containing protein [Vicinamibacterales bacterium]|nr:CHAD domain-containing protein [Vicinamibacterales bacterium]
MNVQTSYDRLWRKRLDALRAVWPAFLAGNHDALHKTRVASRRIREALPIVGAAARPDRVKKLRRKLRALTRHLGPIRELDVEIGMLEKQAENGENVSAAALSVVRREVASERHTLRDRLGKQPPVADLKRTVRKLERIAAAKEGGSQDVAWRSALATTLMKRARRLKAALEDAGPLYAPERIHGVRIAAKKLRYALEIADEAGQPGAKTLVRVLRRQQDRLGRLHDLQALLKHVRGAQASPRAGEHLAELIAYADTLDRDCRQLHAQFVEGRDELFECVVQVRHTMVPALTTGHFRQARVTSPARRARARMTKKA